MPRGMVHGHRLHEFEKPVNVKHMELGNPKHVRFKFLLSVTRWRAPSVATPQGRRPVGDWTDGELGVRPSPAWHRLGNLCCT